MKKGRIRAGGVESEEQLLNVHRVLVREDEKLREINSSDGNTML